jgi:hypothetical protein
MGSFMCECEDRECAAEVTLSVADYERLRIASAIIAGVHG